MKPGGRLLLVRKRLHPLNQLSQSGLTSHINVAMVSSSLQNVKMQLPVYALASAGALDCGERPFMLRLSLVKKRNLCLVGALMFFNVATAAMAAEAAPRQTISVVLTAELIKSVSSFTLLVLGQPRSVGLRQSLATSFTAANSGGLFTVAALYLVVNNCFMLTLRHVDINTYQVLFSLRIPVTAALLFIFLRRRFSTKQVIATGLLLCGALLTQADLRNLNWVHTPKMGLLYVGAMVVSSSIAGVLNEAILKNDKCGSLHANNFLLYTFGFLLNLAFSVFRNSTKKLSLGMTILDADVNIRARS